LYLFKKIISFAESDVDLIPIIKDLLLFIWF